MTDTITNAREGVELIRGALLERYGHELAEAEEQKLFHALTERVSAGEWLFGMYMSSDQLPFEDASPEQWLSAFDEISDAALYWKWVERLREEAQSLVHADIANFAQQAESLRFATA